MNPNRATFRSLRVAARCLAVLVWLGSFGLARAQNDPPDRIAFNAAVAAMEDRQFDRAAKEFTEFLNHFPESSLRQEATERALQAKGEGELVRQDHAKAADTFAAFQRTFPGSARAVLAAVGEASARLRIPEHAKVVEVLTNGGGVFQKALAAKSPPEPLFRGLLLLAEARAATKAPDAAVAALDTAVPFARTPMEQWQRQRLLVDVLAGAGRADAAIAAAEKLQELGKADALKSKRSEANAVLAEALERGGRLDRARQVWEMNLGPDVPPEAGRRAATRVAELLSTATDLVAARQRLEEFVKTAGPDGGGPRIRLLLAQTLFKMYVAARGAKTNTLSPETTTLLTQALGHFEIAATNAADTVVTPLAQLGRGWCLWEQTTTGQGTNRLAEAAEAFRGAAENLPKSADQAVARFKLADCQLVQKLPALALTNYLWVSERYPDIPKVHEELVEPALLQVALVATDLGQIELAGRAVERLLTLDATGDEVQQSVLLAGKALARAGGGPHARELFVRFSEKFPNAPLRADAQLALAASWMREERWTNALAVLAPWVERYGTNHSAAPRAQFDLAYAAEQAGMATNSIATFRDLVNRFPTHPLAQTTLLMLGDQYSQRGDFATAEQFYVTIFTNVAWAGLPAQHQARLGAARAALARGSPPTARERLTTLINDAACPTNLLAESLFVLGSAWFEEVPEGGRGTNSTQNFIQAITAFGKVEKYDPTHERVPQAWCMIGECALMIAATDTNRYSQAVVNYQKTLAAPNADIAWRIRAKIGLANVAHKTGDNEGALEHYRDILYGKIRRPGEELDSYYTWVAGREAAELLVELGRRTDAAALYERLADMLPRLKPLLQKRAAELREAAANR